MKQTVIIIVLFILSIASIGAVMSSSEWGERDDDDQYEHAYESEDRPYGFFKGGWVKSRADVYPAENELYRTECGSCHFAYQPGLLPQDAWAHIMDALDDHYGDDASLDERQAAEIRSYLIDNAASQTEKSRSRAFAVKRGELHELPRITETSYFRHEHYEIPTQFVRGNKDVGGFGNCQACHRSAETGVYNEHQVVIPGFGRWDD
jgi:hypothetical protein